jgi:hypothetical protein
MAALRFGNRADPLFCRIYLIARSFSQVGHTGMTTCASGHLLVEVESGSVWLPALRRLFELYSAMMMRNGVDLDSFQQFSEELASLPSYYSATKRGRCEGVAPALLWCRSPQ